MQYNTAHRIRFAISRIQAYTMNTRVIPIASFLYALIFFSKACFSQLLEYNSKPGMLPLS